MASAPRIAIVGGGPAGLALGCLLHRRHIPFTLFELRNRPTGEELAEPSGMLDLHDDTGLAVVEECGLSDEFTLLIGECSENFCVADWNADLVHTHYGTGTRPEISRNNLAKLFMGHLPSENMRWGHKLLAASDLASSRGHKETELDFGPHGKHTFDLVIGADGAWSKVRRLLTDTSPQFTGTYNVTLTVKNITSKYPHLAELVGSGSFTSLGHKQAVISQRGPIDSSRIYLWLTIPDENFAVTSGLADTLPRDAKEKLLADGGPLQGFGPAIKELVSTACDEESADHPNQTLNIRALYKLPHGLSWEHQRGATLVGDAAHLMLPNGEGVNQAMNDSLLLSKIITEAFETAPADRVKFQSTLDPLLKDFEVKSVERANAIGKETDFLINMMFANRDAAQNMAAFFKEIEQGGKDM